MNTIILIISIDFDSYGYKQVKVTKKGEVIATFASGKAHVDYYNAIVYATTYGNNVLTIFSSTCGEFVMMANYGYFGEERYKWIDSEICDENCIGELFVPVKKV